MRSIPLAVAALTFATATAFAQQPAHPPEHPPAPSDTSMAGMPGMKRPAAAPADTTPGRKPARDTSPMGMPGMRHGAERDTSTARRGIVTAPRGGAPSVMSMNHGSSSMGRDSGMAGPLGVPESRDASGTAWQPDVTSMFAWHRPAGRWSLMFHGNAFLEYIGQGSDRGEQQLGSVNWFMGMARRTLAGGSLSLRGMLSLEPLTVGKCGYPDLLATGESCNGKPLHDRQHPHDVFMEVAARYQRALGHSLALEVYGGPAGEPALGPVAFPHRVSALWSPMAPISHHWQDATHIAYGVLTGGIFGPRWKLEGSAFNGREPDDNRYDFDLGALDSYSGRLWFLPSARLALQVSTGYLRDAELTTDGAADVHRSTASLEYQLPLPPGGSWASTLVWGQNRAHGLVTSTQLAESSLDVDGRNVFYGRGELAQKTGQDLSLDDEALARRVFRVGKLALGYTRQVGTGAMRPAVGGELSLNFAPLALKPFYGSATSAGFSLHLSIRPAAMGMATPEAMARTAGRGWNGLEPPLPPPSPAAAATP